MFYYIDICDDKCENTITNISNATAPPPEEKDENHTTSLYATLKLING